jgi:hypothetical protein
MKKDRAALNKLVTAFENERKRIKKFYMEPYEKFEGQVKELLAPVRDAIGVIDQGLDEIDQKFRAERLEKMRGFYLKYAGDLEALVPFERTVKEELFKKSKSDKVLEQYFSDYFRRISSDLEALDELPEQFRDRAKIEYLNDFSIANALREGRRLEAQEKALQDLRSKQQEAQELVATSQAAARIPEGVQLPESSQDAVSQASAVREAPEPAALVRVDFRVWGTQEQLLRLRDYMKQNQIRYGKVE